MVNGEIDNADYRKAERIVKDERDVTQEEMWINHLHGYTVNDVLQEYQNPAEFQLDFARFLGAIYDNDARVIEVGCETGVTSLLLPQLYRKTLIDLNPIAINLAKRVFATLGREAEFIQAYMFEMPFKNESFDLVFNAGVIEHFDSNDRVKALREYARILKQGGYMCIAFPNHYTAPYRIAYKIKNLLKRWKYPKEYKIFDLRDEVEKIQGLVLEERRVLAKGSVFRWMDFSRPIMYIFMALDKIYGFEGYLTVIKIRKVSGDHNHE